MEIRTVTAQELEACRRLCFTAFESSIDSTATPGESAAKILSDPVTRMQSTPRNTLAAFLDGAPAACLSSCIYRVRFDGSEADMAGVGDVASLPRCQGKGVMRELFLQMLSGYYRQRVPFSYLYPFSGTYYAQYGYSYCVKQTLWELNLDKLPHFPREGRMELYSPEQLDAVKTVYEDFTRGLNLAVCREDMEWRHIIGQFDPAVDRIFTYVYYDEANCPSGYLIYNREQGKHGGILNCREFCYRSREGLLGLLSFCRSKGAYYEIARIPLPERVPLELLLTEFSLPQNRPTGIRQRMHGMVRVVHVKAALKAARFQGEGRVALNLLDPLLPDNCGLWQIAWKDGQLCSCERRDGCEGAQFTMDIGLFSRLLCRGITPQAASLLPKELQALPAGLFPAKDAGILEYF